MKELAPGAPDPDYLAQNGEALSMDERHAWFRARAKEAHEEKGCTLFRYSIHPTIENLILIEAWKLEPEHQGEPRWQLVAA